MSMSNPLLDVADLHLSLPNRIGKHPILRGVSFQIHPGESVGLVGESGCGKSLTSLTLMGLHPTHSKLSGKIHFEGQDLLNQTPKDFSKLRGNRLSLILQDPALALNPLVCVGTQLIEGLRYHKKLSYQAAYTSGIEWLDRVGISDAKQRMQCYPHQLSGGMKQRILIAMALICQPSLLIADEPTTALDVTVQKQILDLLLHLQCQEKTSILLITHDLGVIARCCNRILVMYAGQIIESGPTEQVLTNPRHPYTKALLSSKKSLEQKSLDPLKCLEGSPPPLNRPLEMCAFYQRCPSTMNICKTTLPPDETTDNGSLKCWLPGAAKDCL